MEFVSPEFFAALAAIVLIDLVLAGDNAVVIALAARSLPPRLQKRAVLWGAAGAIAVRATMTAAVVTLLKVPGLLLAGGALLIWIAYRLLVPDEKDGNGHGASASTFWGAMRTIVIADAVMGLDNVLGVAGAAHGSYLLVILGLLISVPIVVWGSTVILQWVERFPAIVYLGAAVLAGTAAKMIAGEPLLRSTFAAHGWIAPVLYLACIGAVLWAGLVRNGRRLESRLHHRLAELARSISSRPTAEREPAMEKVLVPVDGSRNALHAVRHVIQRSLAEPLEVHLLNVQPPFSRHVAQFAARRAREDWHRERADKALAPARALLRKHNIAFAEHFGIGDRAKLIAGEAQRLRCDRIVMATARRNSLSRLLDLSVTERVLDHATLPVEVITGDAVPALERFGLPAGLGAGIALLIAVTLD